MPARVFLSSNDISAVMGISIREAYYVIDMFELRGQVVRRGKRKMVDVRVLTQHLCEQDGADPIQRRKDILEVVREIDREKREHDEEKGLQKQAESAAQPPDGPPQKRKRKATTDA